MKTEITLTLKHGKFQVKGSINGGSLVIIGTSKTIAHAFAAFGETVQDELIEFKPKVLMHETMKRVVG